MDFVNEIFANVFGSGDWAAKVEDASKYRIPNSGRHARGDPYPQLHHHYPALEPFYTAYERDYDPEPLLNWMKTNNYMLPIGAVVAYVLFIFWLGPLMMKDRKPMNLQYPLAAWNLFLSTFSFWGASRTVPWLLYRISTESFEDTVCKSAHVAFGGGTAGIATQYFILSKIPELVDTVFLVLKKKPVIFLHWYHHITVLLYCWNSYVTESAAGLYFVAMNYTVHALMYFYFFLMAIKMVPKWFPPIILTCFQISQMIVGTSVVGACIYYHYYGTTEYNYILGTKKCSNVETNLYCGGIMYASYLYLFVEFAFKRFFFGINDYEKKPKTKQA
jgi:elongation of very long chain fatty acids protein 6